MRLPHLSSRAQYDPGRRPGALARVAVAVAAIVAASAAVACAVLLASSLGVVAAVALAVADIALVPFAIRWRPGVVAATDSSHGFDRGFNDAAIGMMILTPQLDLARVNTALCAILGRDAGELVGHSILEFTHPDDLQRSVEKRTSMMRTDTDAPLVKRYVRPDGSIVEAIVTAALVKPDAAETYFFSQLQDVTEQRRAERQKAAIADLGHRALQCTDVTVLIGEAMCAVRDTLGVASCLTTRRLADGEVRIVAATGDLFDPRIAAAQPTQTAYTLLGSEPVLSNDLPGETRFSVPAMVEDNGLRRGLSVPVPERSGARHVILAHAHGEGRPFTGEDARFLEAVAHVLAGALDRAATEHELRRRALEDPLTGLANRALLTRQLEAELRHSRRLGDRVCLLTLDLDRFKTINDTLGHTLGDTLLREVAVRLTACVREEDLVAHPGGDEFMVLATRTASDHAIAEVAHRLVDAVLEPFEIDDHEVFVTASVGVAVSEHGHETPEELLRDADAAMYRAKELGGGRYEAFDVALRDRLIERMEIERDLRHAVKRDQLELYYQPLIDLADERIVGFEALLRWRHPERGLMNPGQFIQIAEETGLIVAIGSWVLNSVCEQLTRWPEAIHVSANVSAVQIQPELVGEVEQLLARHRITPARLVLEITESLVLEPRTKPIVARLRELGVQLALDDFGTGYSSLGSLQRFPLDVLKLDQSLIESLPEGTGVAVVRAAVELGHALGVQVIAEGIEGPVQLGALRKLGCPLGQGFHFARPLTLADAQLLLQSSGQSQEPTHQQAA
jgi:diguanylate cyclase (GGDEF)-like protein/PAS domain S-box-containing protein